MEHTTLFFDLETGGLKDHHPDIQIAAIAVREWEEVGALEVKIDFDATKADPDALRINSYSEDVWREMAVPESVAVSRFAAFCNLHASLTLTSKRTGNPYSVARLAGHNIVAFDIPRLRRMFQRHGAFLPACFWYPLDTYQRAIWYFAEHRLEPPENFRLETLAKHFGRDASGTHDALADVRITAQIARDLSA